MKTNGKQVKFFLLIFVSIFFTHAILLCSISGELSNAILFVDGAWRSLKTFLYVLIFSFFPAGGYFALISCFLKRPHYIKHSLSAIYLSVYFSWVLFVLIYHNYAGFIPKLEVLANPQEVTSVVYQILHQFVDIKEWCIFAMMLASLYVSIPLIQEWREHLALSRRKKIFISLLFILSLKGPVQYTVKKHWPWNFDQYEFSMTIHKMLIDRNVQAFRQGFLVYYLWYYFYEKKFLADVSQVKYPGPINKNTLSLNKIPKKKYNIITIQVESLAKQVIGLRDNAGQEITPFLNKLKEQSLYFPNFYAQHGGGHSSDAELALFLSLLPMETHPGMSTAKTDYIREGNLVSILKDNGYETAAFHGNEGDFFNRKKNYAKIGINWFYDSEHYHDKAVGFYTSRDVDFFLQSVPKIKSLKRPFFAHLITMQSHSPFKNYDKKTLEKMEFSGLNTLTRNYLVSMREVSDAIEKLFESMKAEGILEDTIVLLYSDHVPGKGVVFDKKCPAKCIPLFIYAPQIIESKQMAILGTHLDIAPTILDMLGIVPVPTPKWLGSSLFNHFHLGKFALLPQKVGLIWEKNGIVKRMQRIEGELLKFYHYSYNILYSN